MRAAPWLDRACHRDQPVIFSVYDRSDNILHLGPLAATPAAGACLAVKRPGGDVVAPEASRDRRLCLFFCIGDRLYFCSSGRRVGTGRFLFEG